MFAKCSNNIIIYEFASTYIQSNLTHLSRTEYVPGIGLGIGKCPYDPYDNSTAVYVEKGNPGALPALVSVMPLCGYCSNIFHSIGGIIQNKYIFNSFKIFYTIAYIHDL